MSNSQIKLCIFGSRTIDKPIYYQKIIKQNVLKYFDVANIECIVSGLADGVDKFGVTFADEFGLKVAEFPAQWDLFGKSAGMVRNRQMAEFATHFIGFQLNDSKGTKNMIEIVKQLHKPIVIIKLKEV